MEKIYSKVDGSLLHIVNRLKDIKGRDDIIPEDTEDEDEFEEDEPMSTVSQIKIISHKDKDDWELVPKYDIGNS